MPTAFVQIDTTKFVTYDGSGGIGPNMGGEVTAQMAPRGTQEIMRTRILLRQPNSVKEPTTVSVIGLHAYPHIQSGIVDNGAIEGIVSD